MERKMRLDHYENHEIRSASVSYIVFIAILDRKIRKSLLRFLYTVLTKFFLSQFLIKVKINKIPIVSVDHPFDDKIPFRPEMVHIYLDFIKTWVTAISYLRKHLGKSSNNDIAEFLTGLANCYEESYYIYKNCVSTTERPRKIANWKFGLIKAVDPHLYCVPSLHVMIVCYTFLKFREIYEKHGLFDEVKPAYEYLYHRALLISETVVFVKQHSVNCISSALYMISNIHPEFSSVHVRDFTSKLFTKHLSESESKEINIYINSLYEKFMKNGSIHKKSGGEYKDILIEFLFSYVNMNSK